jgi:hypothetical protein
LSLECSVPRLHNLNNENSNNRPHSKKIQDIVPRLTMVAECSCRRYWIVEEFLLLDDAYGTNRGGRGRHSTSSHFRPFLHCRTATRRPQHHNRAKPHRKKKNIFNHVVPTSGSRVSPWRVESPSEPRGSKAGGIQVQVYSGS